MEQKQMGKHPFPIAVEGAEPIEGVLMVGKEEGKTLVVTAGVHGDEYVAIQAVREILHELPFQRMKGRVIFIPVVNRDGFYEGTYRVPEDGENLNRCFPGRKAGSLTWRMAYALEQTLYPMADFLLDLHGGSSYETMEPLAFFPVSAGEAVKTAARSAARRLSLSYMVQSYARDGLYSWAAQCGIPALLIERGGGGTWSRAETDACKENIYQMMDVLGILPYGRQERIPVEIQDAHYETASARGYWYGGKKPGTAFQEGELLGKVIGAREEALQEIRAPFDGVVLYGAHSLGVKEGLPLLAYGRPCSSE